MVPRIVESDDDSELSDAPADTSFGKGRGKSIPAPAPQRGGGRGKAPQVAATPKPKMSDFVPPRPAARQAAIKANQSMDVEGAVASDEDDELADEDAEDVEEEDAEEEDDEDEDGEGEDDLLEDDYDDELGDTSESARPSPAASAAAAPAMKLKLKFGQSPAPAPKASPTVISLKGKGRGQAVSSPGSVKLTIKSSSQQKKGKGAATTSKGKRKHEEISDFNEFEDDEEEGVPIPDEDDEEDFLSDSGESAVSLSKMTARQRAAHIGAEPDLLELPQAPSKKKILTEDEVAMRKVETSRRRKHLLNKKLEEEKTETIERLLKKPIGRRSGASTSRIAAATKVDGNAPVLPIPGGTDENGSPLPPIVAPAQLPTTFRYISSIKEGKYQATWAVPLNLEDKFTWPETIPTISKIEELSSKPVDAKYPPPRPPPQSRMLKQQA